MAPPTGVAVGELVTSGVPVAVDVLAGVLLFAGVAVLVIVRVAVLVIAAVAVLVGVTTPVALAVAVDVGAGVAVLAPAVGVGDAGIMSDSSLDSALSVPLLLYAVTAK
jgi:hypothetical protein